MTDERPEDQATDEPPLDPHEKWGQGPDASTPAATEEPLDPETRDAVDAMVERQPRDEPA
jgi:hypothetical protein